ncbi:MAG: HAMP domain-containing protein, partial [Ktedonobacteraceae bacterium]|nr:HAMP domain-containing protein [Ktedonobacteraceae bacterium]
MSKLLRAGCAQFQRWKLSLFEKVILVNSAMLVIGALAGLWVTSHHIESHHYLIDTGFIVAATLLTLFVNILLLRASFRPLFHLLSTIRAVSAGQTQARAHISETETEVGELASAFNSMLDRLEAARREQTRLILQAQETEQRRIALELHDEAGQNLTALLVHIEILNQRLQALPATALTPPVREQTLAALQQLNTLTQHTLDSIRVLAQQLRPSVLDDLGLLAAFRWLADDSSQRLNLQVELDTSGIDQAAFRLPAQHETVLFRIAQESLTNIARHAQTQHAWITLTHDQHTLALRIRDDGCGFDATKPLASSGIVGMRERA